MFEELRMSINATYDGSSWEDVTALYWQDGTPWKIVKFDRDVEYGKKTYRCIIIEKWVFDPEDLEALDYAGVLLEEAWEL